MVRIRNRSRGLPMGVILYRKWKFLTFVGWIPTQAPTEVKFICTAKRIHVPVGYAKFHVNRCNELPLRQKT